MNNIERIRERLRQEGLDAVLITDERNQRYAAGFPFTDGAVLISEGGAWLVTDSRYTEAAGQRAEGVAVLQYDRQRPLAAVLRGLIAEAGIERLGAEDGRLSHRAYLSWERSLERELTPLGNFFEELRAAKTEGEIACMRAAQAIAETALEELLHILRPGMTEREAAAELVYSMLRHGAEGNSFDPIVISGKKTSMPHGVPGDERIRPGDFVTMDFGCVKDGYCSDMTRTVAIGSADDEMKNVYATVLAAQLAGIRRARAGIPGRDIDAAARELIEGAGYGSCFGHGFGHGLGLEIHEGPSLSPSGTALLPLNYVCSAEPGIYLPGRFGVRIEDVMILREGRAELMTGAAKDLLMLPCK